MTKCEHNVYSNCPRECPKNCYMCALTRIADLLERIEGALKDVNAALKEQKR